MLYEVRYTDGSHEFVEADSYVELDDKIVFSKTIGPHGEERLSDYPLKRVDTVEICDSKP